MFKISVQDFKPALVNVLGTIRRADDVPPLAQGSIVCDGTSVHIIATDKYIAFGQTLNKVTVDGVPFTLNLDLASLELINKLPKGLRLEVDADGVRAGKITFGKSDIDFPDVKSLIDNVWDEERWNQLERKHLTGYDPSLVKHIKDVKIIPHPTGAGRARLQAPHLRGVMMGVKINGE